MTENWLGRNTKYILVLVVLFFIGAGGFFWYWFSQPIPPQASCGAIVFLQGDVQIPVNDDIVQVRDCFTHAYQTCTAMKMDVTTRGVDAGRGTTYWPVKEDGTCRILARSSTFGVGPSHPVDTKLCQGILSNEKGLLFEHCGNSGNILVPLTATPPPATCGTIVFRQGKPQVPVSQDAGKVRDCFTHAYQSCTAMTMVIGIAAFDTGHNTTFWPVSLFGSCRIIEQPSFTGMEFGHMVSIHICQGVVPNGNGLLFEHCGTDGNVIVNIP